MTERLESPERLFQQLDNFVADIIDQFASQGHGTAVVIETLQEVLVKRQLAYQRDPDPAEDALDEPPTTGPAPMTGPGRRSSRYGSIEGTSRNSRSGRKPDTHAAVCSGNDRLSPSSVKVGKGWLVGGKRFSEKLVSGSSTWNWWRRVFVRGEPVLHLSKVEEADLLTLEIGNRPLVFYRPPANGKVFAEGLSILSKPKAPRRDRALGKSSPNFDSEFEEEWGLRRL